MFSDILKYSYYSQIYPEDLQSCFIWEIILLLLNLLCVCMGECHRTFVQVRRGVLVEAGLFPPLCGDGDWTGHLAWRQAPLAAELQCSILCNFVAFSPLSEVGETEKWFLFFSTFLCSNAFLYTLSMAHDFIYIFVNCS